jgi:hypothetical protein
MITEFHAAICFAIGAPTILFLWCMFAPSLKDHEACQPEEDDEV